ncbi:DUF1636 family protein [uncultured Cohaesibacter sp.]|uniref:DUF1636 family protein n=1 Tax=uncultured Cohaesibacter sp. TaxID=1002546 RepID=UPI002AA64053|nr:hypothetical protein [uncultured Cohaesibacter sp.]
MGKTVSHHISLCTKCQRTKGVCEAGYELARTVAEAVFQAGPMLDDTFEISGYSDLSGCPEKCLVGWCATPGTVYLFGDVTAKQDLDALVLLAQSIITPDSDQTARMHAQPARIGEPVRVPAAIMVVEFESQERVAA